ncbi:LytR/AlgR family response regulator transcription factor [Maribacter sp. ACAM166]|uniref:LytR/AlgR family response regulator transcription factor n=1 Tax=Maribacter sp. ACAM166 TaxID=2508996 RepID=UPI0010FCF46D|nr:LytTR family DNA-binding domain-containing protein [Maribacter sp. ACAM166]TLP79164.1 response regulator transcription factor [Maribacter sp. ACAM166]
MAKINCMVVDDEELARTLLATYIEKLDFLNLVGSAENPIRALEIMKQQPVDLLFLDIQMPELKGTTFAKMIGSETSIIFTTAYSEYALEGYELNAVDYLLKPITFERFVTAVNKVKTSTVIDATDSFTIKSGYDLHKVNYDDILYIESDSEYVTFQMAAKKIISNQRLKTVEQELPSTLFMRVHRSYIVNKTKVTGLKGRDLLLTKINIPVSDSYFEQVKQELF